MKGTMSGREVSKARFGFSGVGTSAIGPIPILLVTTLACCFVLGCQETSAWDVHDNGDGGPGDPDSGSGQPDADGDGSEDSGAGEDGSGEDGGPPDVGPNWDAYFAEDPPPEYCGPEDRPAPEPPGGTPECPDDKNREGCPCDAVGETAPCWPGLRVDRNRGICHDGETVCQPFDEFGHGRWGPCEGYELPIEGATRGAEACNCFSEGRWLIENLVPCIVTGRTGDLCAVSTYLNEAGAPQCPTPSFDWPPEPEPGYDFSTSRLAVDCSGQFRLCLTLKAGDSESPEPTDCVLAETCTETTWYDAADEGEPPALADLPPLGPWLSCDNDCVREFVDEGGYAEMSVVGLSEECEDIGTADEPYVFHVINYCPLYCSEPGHDDDPLCERCNAGASGRF